MTTSTQTRQVWKRLCSWYGADVIERKYGAQAPEDWASVIDTITRDRLERVLADVRAKHSVWPPSLFEFEQLAKAKPVVGPSPVEVLDAYVKQHYPRQCVGMTWIGDRNAITGVHVAGVGRILLKDIQAVA